MSPSHDPLDDYSIYVVDGNGLLAEYHIDDIADFDIETERYVPRDGSQAPSSPTSGNIADAAGLCAA
jgi:hypothetical protein